MVKLYVFKVPNKKSDNLTGRVRITQDAEIKIRELQRASGLSACQVVSQIIIQAADETEIVEVE